MAINLQEKSFRFPNVGGQPGVRNFKDRSRYSGGDWIRLRCEVMDFGNAAQLTVTGIMIDITRPTAPRTLVRELVDRTVADDMDPLSMEFQLVDDPPYRFTGPCLRARLTASPTSFLARFNLSVGRMSAPG